MRFFKSLLKKKTKPCPTHQKQMEDLDKLIEDTNTKVRFIEERIKVNSYKKLVVVKQSVSDSGVPLVQTLQTADR